MDDDSIDPLLARLLRVGGHNVRLPRELGLSGSPDPVHLRHAIREARLLLSHNHDDFLQLHELILESRGHQLGILVVRRDNNRKRDMKTPDIVRAIGKFVLTGGPPDDPFIILNHWR
jgi:hypothetical protein